MLQEMIRAAVLSMPESYLNTRWVYVSTYVYVYV